MSPKGQVRVGMSGWTFPPWRKHFYPKGLVQKKELEYASRQVTSIEINGTFYSLQKPETFLGWAEQVPEDFVFAIKGPQFITHIRRLQNVEEPLCTFLASGPLALKNKLGPFLWQFPPNVVLKDDRFEKFAKLLPHTSREAATLAERHNKKVLSNAWTDPGGDFPVRHAMEFRHPSFKNAAFLEMLRANRVAVVFADSGLKSPFLEDLTSDFVYVRMHGENPKFKKGYTDPYLAKWVKKIEAWRQGGQPEKPELVSAGTVGGPKDVFVYFDNEVKKNSPMDAMRLIKKLEKK